MRVQTTHLEALVWIARLGSFRAAAARLNLSQPTVSMRIRELEMHLGLVLFDRASYRARLTEAGREAVQTAERILSLTEELERGSARTMAIKRPIRLGAADSFALTHLPALLSQLQQSYPRLRVDLLIDFSSNLNLQLQRGGLDLAFMTGPVLGAGMRSARLHRVPLAWVASPRLGLPARSLRPEDLRARAILVNPRPSHLFATVQDWFGSGGLRPERLMTCNSLTVMARLASAGFGVTLLPVDILRSNFELGQLQPLRTDPALNASDMLVVSREAMAPELTGAVEAIGDIARRLVRNGDLGSC